MVLSRYVLREHLRPFLFSFAVIMFLLVLDLILQKIDLILGKGVPALIVLELFFLNTAWMVALAVPMAVLVATLMAFGRLSADNEVSAMRSLGVGIHRIFLPVVLAGILMAVGLVLFNDRVLPEFNYRGRMLLGDIQRKRPAVVLDREVGIFIRDFDRYRILIGNIDPKTGLLEDLLLYKYERGGYPTTITAQQGWVQYLPETDEAVLELQSGEIHRMDETDPEIYVRSTFASQILRLGEAGRHLTRSISRYRTDREMSIGMMLERVRKFDQSGRTREGEATSRFFELLEDVLFKHPSAEESFPAGADLLAQLRADLSVLSHKQRQADRYRVEVHKKLAIPVACIVFVLVGAPLGIRVRGGSPAVGAGISIGFFLVWWLFLIGGETLADRGHVAPWFAMWSPNLLVGVGGVWLVKRTVL